MSLHGGNKVVKVELYCIVRLNGNRCHRYLTLTRPMDGVGGGAEGGGTFGR